VEKKKKSFIIAGIVITDSQISELTAFVVTVLPVRVVKFLFVHRAEWK
jgi:hypothetical protein